MVTPVKHHRFFIISLIILVLVCGSLYADSNDYPGGTVPWKFAVVSDTQGNNRERDNKSCINDAVVRAIAEDIVQEKPDFVLVAGDLVNGWFRNGRTDYAAQYANWKKVMRPVYDAGIRVYPIRGNHDSGPERIVLPPLPAHLEPPAGDLDRLRGAFLKSFSEPYTPLNGPPGEEGFTYSFTHKNAFIVGLDQNTCGQHKIDQVWLDRQLAGNKNPHVFIYGHEPAFEANHKDNLAFYPKDRDAFWDAIGRAGGRIYFCGHDHFYDRALIPDNRGNGIWQIIAATGGGALRTWPGAYKEDKRVKGEYRNSDHHGYILVTVEGPKVTVAWRAIVKENSAIIWRILDSFTYTLPDTRN